MKKYRTLAASIVLLFLIAVMAPAEDWPIWRGPDKNGISKETKWNPAAVNSPKIKWKKELGQGHSSIAVQGSALYTMANKDGKDIIYCLSTKDGKTIWEYSYECGNGNYPGPRSMPVLDNGSVYTYSRNGHVHCLDAKKGTVKWKANVMEEYDAKNITWGLAGSPCIVGDMVILNGCQHGIALNKTTGKKIWASPPGKCGYATPMVYNNKGKDCVAIPGCTHVYGVDLKTGRKLWSHDWKTKYDILAADPVYFDGKIYFSSGYGKGACLLDISGSSPKTLWTNPNMANHFSSSILIGDYLYGVDGNTGSGSVVCVSTKDGKEKWRGGKKSENLMCADGKLIVIDRQGDLSIVAAEPSGYKELARGTVLNGKVTNWPAPVLANGSIYCRNSGGLLICVDVSK